MAFAAHGPCGKGLWHSALLLQQRSIINDDQPKRNVCPSLMLLV